MNKNELCEQLKKDYSDELKGGLLKIDDPDWQNILFVVPPPPPKEINSKLPYSLLAEANKTFYSLPTYDQMSELDKLINYLFVRREVVQSSRLEGTWSTIDHALTPTELSEKGEGSGEHEAVRSYANTLDELIQETSKKKEKIFNIKLIKKIQKNIVKKNPNSTGIPGKLRTPGAAGRGDSFDIPVNYKGFYPLLPFF